MDGREVHLLITSAEGDVFSTLFMRPIMPEGVGQRPSNAYKSVKFAESWERCSSSYLACLANALFRAPDLRPPLRISLAGAFGYCWPDASQSVSGCVSDKRVGVAERFD